MIEAGKTYVIMGLLDPSSIAYAVGSTIAALGGKVLYTVQNEYIKSMCWDESSVLSDEEKQAIEFRYCDVTKDDQIEAVFAGIGPVAGVLHSVAYANPRTLLGTNVHTRAYKDIANSMQISAVSLATITEIAAPNLVANGGGSIVTMTFDSRHAHAYYNWMSVSKAALEAVVRMLARAHGKEQIRVNAVSAGPLRTMAASKIPNFDDNARTWNTWAPLGWDPDRCRQDVAEGVVFLLGRYARRITGQVLYIDGGADCSLGALKDFEQAP